MYSKRMRKLHELYASAFGYFWLPCPKCGEMFGGHEVTTRSTTVRIDGRNKIACPKHDLKEGEFRTINFDTTEYRTEKEAMSEIETIAGVLSEHKITTAYLTECSKCGPVEGNPHVHVAEALVAAGYGSKAETWDESAEVNMDFMCNQSTPSGIPIDPPENPYK